MIAPRLLLLCSCLALTAPGFSQAPAAPTCNGPEHHQFDFWVGQWNVYRTGTDELAGHSLIEKLYEGCVIRENWMPLRGSPGGSFNTYNREENRWHQTWVSGANVRVEFNGGRVDDKMVLSGFWKNSAGPGKHGLIRMTYSRLPDGSVRQLGELSTDHGLSWTESFDFTYRAASNGSSRREQGSAGDSQ